jgi:hypothetical protein
MWCEQHFVIHILSFEHFVNYGVQKINLMVIPIWFWVKKLSFCQVWTKLVSYYDFFLNIKKSSTLVNNIKTMCLSMSNTYLPSLGMYLFGK